MQAVFTYVLAHGAIVEVNQPAQQRDRRAAVVGLHTQSIRHGCGRQCGGHLGGGRTAGGQVCRAQFHSQRGRRGMSPAGVGAEADGVVRGDGLIALEGKRAERRQRAESRERCGCRGQKVIGEVHSATYRGGDRVGSDKRDERTAGFKQ
jgi:hypothetical protein